MLRISSGSLVKKARMDIELSNPAEVPVLTRYDEASEGELLEEFDLLNGNLIRTLRAGEIHHIQSINVDDANSYYTGMI